MPQRCDDHTRGRRGYRLESGIGEGSPSRCPSTQWREGLAVDLDEPFLRAQRVVHRIVAGGRGGRINNIARVQEHAPRVGFAAGVRGSRVWR